jgi:hypothetical protein
MTAADTAARSRPARAAARPQNRADATGPGRRPRSRAESAARAYIAGELSATGIPYSEIAPHLGYSSPASAQRAVTRAAAGRAVDHIAETRALILPILDRIIDDALADAHTTYPRTYRGKVILTDPDDPTSIVPDWRRTLRAISAGLRAMDQRAKLLGLYPSQPGPPISRRHPLARYR